jgi:chemotaxis response regulator CheB
MSTTLAGSALGPTRVLVADDAVELRRLVCDMLDRQDDLIVVGEAARAEEALELTETLRPDVVLLDYLLPGADADALVDGVYARAHGAALVGFSGYYPEILAPATRRRLSFHLDKMCGLTEVARTVRQAASMRASEVAPHRTDTAAAPPSAATIG